MSWKSNTVIFFSFDIVKLRTAETFQAPALTAWCHLTGLLFSSERPFKPFVCIKSLFPERWFVWDVFNKKIMFCEARKRLSQRLKQSDIWKGWKKRLSGRNQPTATKETFQLRAECSGVWRGAGSIFPALSAQHTVGLTNDKRVHSLALTTADFRESKSLRWGSLTTYSHFGFSGPKN